ncbi:MAG: hypothetical protein IT532_11670 [Burkholderiales bacterium]|nr:hypothetical protein [Burkholderiales bacterium]
MSGVTKWLLFRIPGGIAGLLAVSWTFFLFIFQLDGRDVTSWASLWPWALGLLLGGSFWMAIPDGFGDNSRSPRQP